MNIKHKLLLTAAVVVISGGTVLSSTQAFAQSADSDTNPMSSLVQKIADKFGLNKDEVRAVFNESKKEMNTQHQARYESRLSQLVIDGKITEAQKQLIIAKNKELEANRHSRLDSMNGRTDKEQKIAAETRRTALKEWAGQNGIDMQYLMLGHGGRPGGPNGFGGHPEGRPNMAGERSES